MGMMSRRIYDRCTKRDYAKAVQRYERLVNRITSRVARIEAGTPHRLREELLHAARTLKCVQADIRKGLIK